LMEDERIEQRWFSRKEVGEMIRTGKILDGKTMVGYFLWLDWLDDISPLLAAADLFVSPSHSESFGLAILDAMAAGAPVIATATHGASTLISDTDALVPVRDPLALATAITEYLDDPERRLALGKRLAGEARSKFSLAAMCDATERVYKGVLET